MSMRIAITRVLLAAGVFLGAPSLSIAQDYPTRTITLISPYPPGGPTSDTGRLLADGLSKQLGHPVIVENVGGAGGTIGVGRVARAAPDGYTLLIHNMAIASSVTLFPTLPFNTEKDFTGISLINTSPLVIVGRKDLPADDLAGLVKWMKAAPTIKFAQAGTGNMAHLCGALFVNEVGVKVDMIPYRGGAPALQDVIGGHVDLYCSVAPAAVPAIDGGLVKAFGMTSKETYQPLPKVPLLTKTGMSDKLAIEYWHGLWAPAGTPKPIIDKLNKAVQAVLADPQTAETWRKVGIEVYPKAGQTPAATDAYLKSEIARWAKVIKDNDIKAGP
jgi:tripartite-type tricarboxylate transporter receptor subunit TctC